MKKVKEFLKKLWKAFDGEKTKIALVLYTAAQSGVFGEHKWIAVSIAILLGGPGILHSLTKVGTKLKNGGK